MSNPKPLVDAELLKSLTAQKPAEATPRQGGPRLDTKAPMPKVKASTRPVRSTVTQTRSTNRGK